MKLSTFLSCKNHGAYVGAAIDSVMSQSVRPDEFTLINDGSQDDTNAVFTQAARTYPEVRIVTHAVSQGHINGYNEGILRSSGEVLHLMSADDVLADPHFYEQGREALQTACIYAGGLQWMDEKGTLLPTMAVPPLTGQVPAELTLRAMLQFGNFICGAATLVRADLQKQHLYDALFPFTADAVNWARILTHGVPAHFTSHITFLYRRHSAQMTHVTTGTEEERLRMREEIAKCLQYARLAQGRKRARV